MPDSYSDDGANGEGWVVGEFDDALIVMPVEEARSLAILHDALRDACSWAICSEASMRIRDCGGRSATATAKSFRRRPRSSALNRSRAPMRETGQRRPRRRWGMAAGRDSQAWGSSADVVRSRLVADQSSASRPGRGTSSTPRTAMPRRRQSHRPSLRRLAIWLSLLDEPVEQLAGADFECSGEAEDGRDPHITLAVLDPADLGRRNAATAADILLREAEPTPGESNVAGELGDSVLHDQHGLVRSHNFP